MPAAEFNFIEQIKEALSTFLNLCVSARVSYYGSVCDFTTSPIKLSFQNKTENCLVTMKTLQRDFDKFDLL